MINPDYIWIKKYQVWACCEEPLHIGGSTGDRETFLVHPVMDEPFIQATSIAGVFSQYIQQKHGPAKRDQIFGRAEASEAGGEKSRLTISDGIFDLETVKLESRTRVKIDGHSGTSAEEKMSGQLLRNVSIAKGAKFSFCIYAFQEDKEGEQQLIVEELLRAFHKGRISIGGQISNGCGRVRLEKIETSEFDLESQEGRKKWAREEPGQSGVDDTAKILKTDDQELSETIQFEIEAELTHGLLVKADIVDEELAEKKLPGHGADVDAFNVTNANDDYVLPGSSVKGVLRGRMEAIIQYLCASESKDGSDEIAKGYIKTIFEDRGKLRFYDTVIKESKTDLTTRIRLNRFTGGVRHQGLFSEAPIEGKAMIHIDLDSRERVEWGEDQVHLSCGLLLYALRDLALGCLSLGGGAAIGRGFPCLHSINIKEGNKQICRIDLKNWGITGERTEFVQECMNAVQLLG